MRIIAATAEDGTTYVVDTHGIFTPKIHHAFVYTDNWSPSEFGTEVDYYEQKAHYRSGPDKLTNIREARLGVIECQLTAIDVSPITIGDPDR